MTQQFETARTIIRPHQLSDADAAYEVLRHPLVYRTTYAIPKDFPRARVNWWISFQQSARKNKTGFEFGVFEKSTGRYLGSCGIINVRRDLQSGVITYFIHPDFWGRGFATEAGACMLSFAFQSLSLMRVSGTCMSMNPASRRVMEKLGFFYEGTARCELMKDGVFIDVDHLALLRTDAPAALYLPR